jgi:sulfhydrogenase subunit beta (sulfur reductase)
MSVSFIRSDRFPAFVASLVAAGPVYGPVAKRTKFAFGRLESAGQLRLDYDVTILPPKKLFFPPAQDLIRFDGDRLQAAVEPEEKVLLGVHPYDVKAIDITDAAFRDRHYDVNYMAHRETTTLVASIPERVSARAFWATVGAEIRPNGHDGLLAKIAAGYLYEARSTRGEALLARGEFVPATDAQRAEAAAAEEAIAAACPERIGQSSAVIAAKVRAAYADEALWDVLAADCFGCGSCNIVCPTCYCFNVEDAWNVDQKSGARTRYWDACLGQDFAKVSLGAGATENFRETRGERFRHRIMRKAVYLNEKLGGPACVGCGRCASACPADIADPVRVVDRILAEEH